MYMYYVGVLYVFTRGHCVRMRSWAFRKTVMYYMGALYVFTRGRCVCMYSWEYRKNHTCNIPSSGQPLGFGFHCGLKTVLDGGGGGGGDLYNQNKTVPTAPSELVVCHCFLQPKLPEGLLTEAEKALHALVCFTMDRCIKTKFIEACIQNLADHK